MVSSSGSMEKVCASLTIAEEEEGLEFGPEEILHTTEDYKFTLIM